MSKLKEIQEVLALNVRRLRKEFAPTDRDAVNTFAKYLGVGNNVLGALEKGEANPQLDTLVKIAAKFGMEPWHLFIRDATPDNKPRVVTDRYVREVMDRAFGSDEMPTPQPVPPQHLATPKRVAHRGRKRKSTV